MDTCDSVQYTILRDDVTLKIVPGFLSGFQQIVKKLILYGMLFFMDENFLAGSALLIVKKDMEELVRQLRAFLGSRAKDVAITGPAEINITAAENEGVPALSAQLQSHIVEIVDENTSAKINIIAPDGIERDSFSLNQ